LLFALYYTAIECLCIKRTDRPIRAIIGLKMTSKSSINDDFKRVQNALFVNAYLYFNHQTCAVEAWS